MSQPNAPEPKTQIQSSVSSLSNKTYLTYVNSMLCSETIDTVQAKFCLEPPLHHHGLLLLCFLSLRVVWQWWLWTPLDFIAFPFSSKVQRLTKIPCIRTEILMLCSYSRPQVSSPSGRGRSLIPQSQILLWTCLFWHAEIWAGGFVNYKPWIRRQSLSDWAEARAAGAAVGWRFLFISLWTDCGKICLTFEY